MNYLEENSVSSTRKLSKTLKSWSPSRYALWSQCPAKAMYKHIMRLPEPSSPAAERGTAIHLEGELYLKGEIEKVPVSYAKFAKDLQTIKKKAAEPERNYTFTREWQLTSGTDWENAWLRMRLDALVQNPKEKRVIVIDFKTGKVRDGSSEYRDQVELGAMAALIDFPNMERATTELWFLDHKVVVGGEVERKNLEPLKRKWELRVKPMLEDTKFPARPGVHCRWCAYSHTKRGPCKAG